MTKQKCWWVGCDAVIEVDTSRDTWFSTVGWCEFHHKVYTKQRELLIKYKLDANKLFKTDTVRYYEIQREAIELVMQDRIKEVVNDA